MNNFYLVKEIIKNNGGIATTADFKSAGLENYKISGLCNKNLITRIRHGYYCLTDNIPCEEQILANVLPEGIVCLDSALYHYGYSDYAPLEWTIAVPRAISLSKLKIDEVPIVPHFITKNNYALGKTESDFNGVILNIYDRERTICDCFKYRSQIDNEVFAKAINAYANDNNKNLSNLSFYSKQLRVYKKMTEMMEVILND